MPGIIQSVDFTQQTCVVQIAVQMSITDIQTGTSRWASIAPLLDCPLFFPHGGNASITFPVAAGDECLVVFASRCIDGWWQNGAVQPQALFRMHDLSDGFVFAGFRSTPKVISNISTTKLQIRSDDGSNFIELDTSSGKVNIKAATSITFTAPNVNIEGDANISGALVVDGITFATHKHSGVSTGIHNTGPPA
jgi:hypothetical protein